MLILIFFAISTSQRMELQRAAERIQMVQQRPSTEQRDREAYWAVEDRYAKAQRDRKATPAELDRLVMPKNVVPEVK